MATIKTAYVSKGNIQVSKHFKLKELQCKDKTDKVLYCPETLEKLEKLRDLTKCSSVTVTSGYRTPAHNKKIGGASTSSHTEGYALDVHFKDSKYTTKQICCMAQDLGIKGIAYISSNAIHIDMKNRTYRGDERYGYSNNVNGDFYAYFGIKKGSLPTNGAVDTSKFPTIKRKNASKYVTYVRQLQIKLNEKGFKGANKKALTVDGKWGDNTDYALANFQKKNNLKADKICGKNTWKLLYK